LFIPISWEIHNILLFDTLLEGALSHYDKLKPQLVVSHPKSFPNVFLLSEVGEQLADVQFAEVQSVALFVQFLDEGSQVLILL
jgi:hypothetical protein